MIEPAVFILVLCGFSFAVVWCADAFKRSLAVTCRCGCHRAENPVIFDPSDRVRIADLLSENCSVCRSQRRAAGVVSAEEHTPQSSGAQL